MDAAPLIECAARIIDSTALASFVITEGLMRTRGGAAIGWSVARAFASWPALRSPSPFHIVLHP